MVLVLVAVLGNHDLHLLATAAGVRKPGSSDTLDDILQAPDREQLLDWLASLPLMHCQGGHTLVHAGIPPQWSIQEALARAVSIIDRSQKKGVIHRNTASRYKSRLTHFVRGLG